ncbi:sensor histidine kinase [Candidatus Paracaedibacter symbiosus]|uniref:sensor histidine kinase n=1 Tax=Candidatus Paracaedibacter symbiosus TaxID=244582 RepID=UPI001E2DF5ED|nr:HAMP domain-containing sensor histidine kinase [Candidatus Paracaedibacter symbiosus]
MLITNWITFILFLLIGVSLGAFAHYLVAGPTYLNMEVLGGAFVNYLWAAIIAAIFAQRKENIQNIKQKSLKMQAAAIAHEMRTPLSAVKHIVNGLKLHLPTLINTQQTAQEKDQNIPYISKNKLQSLEGMPTKLETIAGSASNVIDMLLMNLRENPPEAVLVKCSMLDCVEIALNAYSLTNQERNLISVERGEDFEIKANQDLLKHVFFNLLKNSLYYVKAAKKGKISIWTEKGQQVNKLHFKDTGKGISKESLPHIFNQFYSRTDHGTGVGLAFCKMVMQHLGGDITCDSVEGEFTQFTLTFPVLK